jgi:hypothetical protein
MSDLEQAVAQTESVPAKTRIAANTEKYQKAKSASGSVSLNNGDRVATAMSGLTLDEAYELAAEVSATDIDDLRAKYAHLNIGQQRMNLGNRIRGVLNKLDKAYYAAKDVGTEPESVSGTVYIEQLAAPFREKVEAREAEAAAVKAQKEAERQAKALAAAKTEPTAE